jgi:hypothetical protein
LIEAANELPGAAKYFFLFDFEDFGIDVEARSESVGALDLLVDVEVQRLGGGLVGHG